MRTIQSSQDPLWLGEAIQLVVVAIKHDIAVFMIADRNPAATRAACDAIGYGDTVLDQNLARQDWRNRRVGRSSASSPC